MRQLEKDERHTFGKQKIGNAFKNESQTNGSEEQGPINIHTRIDSWEPGACPPGKPMENVI